MDRHSGTVENARTRTPNPRYRRSGSTARWADPAARAEDRRRAIDLRAAGWSFEAIGAELGCAKSHAHRLYKEAIDLLLPAEDLEVHRRLELDRLDALTLVHWRAAMAGDLKAGNLLLAISDQRMKLLHLDKVPPPGPVDPSSINSVAEIDHHIRRLIDEMECHEAGNETPRSVIAP